MELRTGSLENKKLIKTRSDVDSVTFTVVLNTGGLDIFTITDERVRMRLTVNNDTRPLVLDDVNESTRDVGILLQDVFSDFLGKDFNVIDVGAAFGDDVDSVLTGVYDDGFLVPTIFA